MFQDKFIRIWDVNWNLPVHANDRKIQVHPHLGHKCIRIWDKSTTTFENKSVLTRDTDIQKGVTQEYEFETALADLIDNSLQAVERRHGKHTRFGVVDSMISIFDSVPRMAGSCEELAIGGQPSNLKTPSTCDLIVENWEDLTDAMPLKIAYPALDQHELRTITGFDPKNTEWSYHNGSSWPMPLMEQMGFRWGTTNVAIMTNEGIILGVDSRSVLEWNKDKFIWREDEEKLQVISAKSNIVFTAMGDATQWHQLFEYLKDMVAIEEYLTKDVVSTLKAFDLAKIYLYQYAKVHPKNELSFGGILAGWNKKSGFEAYEIALYKLLPIHGQMKKFGCMNLGSGGAYAKAVLDNHAQDRSQMSTETAANVVLEALLFAGYCDENTGGKVRVSHLREKDLVPKYNIHSLDAQLQHSTNYGAQQMLFVLFDKSTVTGGLSLGKELRKQWPCGSLFAAHRSAEKQDYYVHSLYFDSEEEATKAFEFVTNALQPPPQPQLQLFKSMQLTLNGSLTSFYVSRCTKDVLTFLCSLV